MRVLAIGATGFVGPHVVRLLTERGHDIAVLHRGRTNADLPADVQHIHGSRHAVADLRSEIGRFKPDVVLDVVPYTERQARDLVETVRGLVRRVVAVSSADVYRNYDGFRGKATAPPDPGPLSEDAPLRETLYPYRGHGLPFDWAEDYDKILVERVVLGETDPAGTVLRFPAVYGPGDKQQRTRPYVRRMHEGQPAVLLEKSHAAWRWTRGYVENVAAAVALVVVDDRAANRVYNIGEEPALTEREWVEKIGMVTGWGGQVVEVDPEDLPNHLRQPFDFRYELATDTGRIRGELLYREPVQREEALRRTVEWEGSQ